MKGEEACRQLAVMATEEGGKNRLMKEVESLCSALTKLLKSTQPRSKVHVHFEDCSLITL